MKIDRRNFLSLGMGVTAGTMLSPLPWKLMDDLAVWTQNWPWTPVPRKGETTHVKSVCTLCPGSCGISIRMVGDRCVKIEGMKEHPVNQGGICSLGLSGLQLLYGPTRIKTPLKRVGKRGAGQWATISWDQAIAEVSEKLNNLRSTDQAHTIAGISGSGHSTLSRLLKRFLSAYGSPNYFEIPSIAETYQTTFQMMNGAPVGSTAGFDLEHADFILSFGCGLLDGWGSPVRMFKAKSAWRKSQAQVIQIESRLSRTAAKSDRWIPINPGTEAALALGMAHVLIQESLYQKEFTDQYASGFETVMSDDGMAKKGFMDIVLEHFSPSAVGGITGLDPAAIILLAREFAKARAPLALFGKGQGTLPGSIQEAIAIHALNALAGRVNRKGGVYALPVGEPAGWAVMESDKIADSGMRQPRMDGAPPHTNGWLNQLPSAILSNRGYPLNALFVMEANPLFTLPDSGMAKNAFDKIPVVVSLSSFMDETVRYADFVLPNHIYLERLEDSPLPFGFSRPVISLSRPVVPPLFNTRHAGDVLIRLAKEIGGSVADAFPWKNFKACLEQAMGDRMAVLEKNGFWMDTDFSIPGWEDGFHTPSGKFDFAGNMFSSDFTPVRIEGDTDFPLTLIPYETMRLSDGYIASPPFLNKILEDTILRENACLVEMNPQTARTFKCSEGDSVILQTPRGEAKVEIHLEEGVMPGIIAFPRGMGHADKGININQLIGQVQDPVSGLDAAWGIRARISRA